MYSRPVNGPKPNIPSYTHVQSTASDQWVVVHNLSKLCSVTVVDDNNTQVMAEIQYDSDNQVTIKFGAASTGRAFCN